MWKKYLFFLLSLDISRHILDPLWTLMRWQWTWNTQKECEIHSNWPSLFSFCCCQCFCQHILLGWLKASSEVLHCIYKGAKSPCILAGCLVLSWKPAWGAKQERDAPYSQHSYLLLIPGAALLLNASAEDHSAQKTRSCRRRRSKEGGFVCSEQMNSGKRRTNKFLPVYFIFMTLDNLL